MHPNLSVKLIGCDAASRVDRGGGWRVDKLANRTSFVRQLGALQDMMEVRQGTSQKAGVARRRDVLVAGWDGNKADRDAVPRMCADEGRTRSERDSKAKDDRPGDGSARHVPHEPKARRTRWKRRCSNA